MLNYIRMRDLRVAEFSGPTCRLSLFVLQKTRKPSYTVTEQTLYVPWTDRR